jgi:hypothetical protein
MLYLHLSWCDGSRVALGVMVKKKISYLVLVGSCLGKTPHLLTPHKFPPMLLMSNGSLNKRNKF